VLQSRQVREETKTVFALEGEAALAFLSASASASPPMPCAGYARTDVRDGWASILQRLMVVWITELMTAASGVNWLSLGPELLAISVLVATLAGSRPICRQGGLQRDSRFTVDRLEKAEC